MNPRNRNYSVFRSGLGGANPNRRWGNKSLTCHPTNAGSVMISDDGLVTITLLGDSPVIILRGIRVDVREVTGEVTAAVSGDGTDAIVGGTVTVISSIKAALDVSTGDATSVLTRGTVDKPEAGGHNCC